MHAPQSHKYTLLFRLDDSACREVIRWSSLLNLNSLDAHPQNHNYHMTLCHFHAGLSSENIWRAQLDDLFSKLRPLDILFDRIQLFSNGALVLLPDEASFQKLSETTALIRSFSALRTFGITRYPHITLQSRASHALICQYQTMPAADIECRVHCRTIGLTRFDRLSGTHHAIQNFHLK